MTKRLGNCMMCRSGRFDILFKSRDRMFNLLGEFNIKKCKDCSLVFLDPIPNSKEIKKYYPSKNYYAYKSNKKKGFFERLRNYLIRHYYEPNLISFIISTFVKNVPAIPRSFIRKGKVIDIGCGAGDTLMLLNSLGWETYGIDIDRKAIKSAREKGLKKIKLGTYEVLSKYPDNFFDVIRLYHVIEHLENPPLCLNLIKKKLKKNGELIIGTPNVESLISKIFGTFWYNLDTPRHLFLFSPDTLVKLLTEKGFDVKKIEFCSAGGIVGSIQYFIDNLKGKKITIINRVYFVLFFYPIEWLLDKLRVGDVFVARASIKQ